MPVRWQRSYNLSPAEFESITNAPEPERGLACQLLYSKAFWKRNELQGVNPIETLGKVGAGVGCDGQENHAAQRAPGYRKTTSPEQQPAPALGAGPAPSAERHVMGLTAPISERLKVSL